MKKFAAFDIEPISVGNDSFTGTAVIDLISGGLGNDTLSGLGGDDVIAGDNGDDSLSGGDGDDLLGGGAGNDTLNGGAGFDLVSYENATAAVKLRLSSSSSQITGGAGRDLLIGIEGLIGSNFNDQLEGDASNNFLEGAAGNDTLKGGGGLDTLVGGAGNDLLDGGLGIDTAEYSDELGDLKLSLILTKAQNTGSAGTDTLTNIENLTGGLGNDQLTGSTQNNILKGGSGNDTLNGGSGSDTLYGGSGDDTYFIDVAGDVAVEENNEGTDTIFSSINYTLGNSFENLTLTNVAAALNGTGNNVGNALFGNSFNNALSGLGGDDTLSGGAGNDTLNGGLGSDTITYADATFGISLALDTAAPQAVGVLGSDVLVSIENIIGGSGNDTLTGDINNNKIDGGAGRDILTGASGADSLLGGAGDDNLSGGAGDDNLTGDVGNDTLNGGAGSNVLNGGAGDDVATYSQVIEDVSVTWIAAEDAFWIVTAGSTDTVTGVEKFNFAGTVFDAAYLKAVRLTAGNDSKTAGNSGEQIYGLGGNDTLIGGNGDDDLYGGSGDDKLYSGKGNDIIEGGTGYDTLYVLDSFSLSTLKYANGAVEIENSYGTITASGIEAIYFGGDLSTNRIPLIANLSVGEAKVLEGNSGVRLVEFTVTLDRPAATNGSIAYTVAPISSSITGADFGLPGTTMPSGVANVIAGQSTAKFTVAISGDTDFELSEAFSVSLNNPSEGLFLGQAGAVVTIQNDDLQYLNANKNSFTGTSDRDFVDGLAGADQLSGLGGADFLIGGAGRDTISGGADNDTLVGGADDDYLYGDDGVDFVSFESTSTGVDANLTSKLARSAQQGTDRLYSIENLMGGSGNDTLTGDDAVNQLFGLGGNDILDGKAGMDSMVGGAGNDVYHVDASGDTVTEMENEGLDRIISGITLTLPASVEILELSGNGVINATGNALNNTLVGNGRNNQLVGADGNDTLTGGAGNDTLTGGSGTDWFNVDSGVDTITDLSGADVLIVSSTATALATISNNFIATSETVINGKTTIIIENGIAANFSTSTGTRGIVLTAEINNLASTLVGTALADTISGGAGGDLLTGGAGGDSIVGNSGNDTISGGIGADYLTGSDGSDNLAGDAGNDTLGGDQTDVIIDGGADSDVLEISSSFITVNDAQLANLETVNMMAAKLALNLSNQTEGFTVNGYLLGASTIVGGLGSDSIVGGNGADILAGGSGVDTILGGYGADTLLGDQGDAILDGGADNDVLQVSSAFLDVSDNQLRNIETVSLTATSVSLNLSKQTEGLVVIGFALGASTIIGGAGSDYISGGTGADFLTGSGGADTIIGGAAADMLSGGEGDDLFLVSLATDLVQGDVINGDGGTDELRFNATTASTLLLTSDVTVERVVIGTGMGASAVTTGTVAINVNAAASTSALAMIGNAGANSLTGSAYNDSLDGGLGADTLIGGAGNDTLTGGLGADVFVFNQAPNATNNIDVYTDFTAVDDDIWLAKSALSGLGAVGALDTDAFWASANGTASDATDRILYDTVTGALYYDADGTGAVDAVQIAKFDAGTTLTAGDFFVI